MTYTLHTIAASLMAPNKGILAADESESTMEKRFTPINVAQDPENNRRYRNLLFTTPRLEEYLSGVILHDQTIRQHANDGTPFAELLAGRGVIPGIKVDLGLAHLYPESEEEVSRGLDTLDARLAEYYALGARFTKWRSVIRIGDDLPSTTALVANAHVLAQYAKAVQARGMVPMVEPEVLFDGTHTLERSREVIAETLRTLFDTLTEYQVDLAGLILKTSMALPGKESGIPLTPSAIAESTLAALQAAVPEGVAGVVFLSGGQTADQATENLNAIARVGPLPWPITFSYSRALEEPVIAAWKGDDAQTGAAQEVLLERLALSVAARNGTYSQAVM